MALDVSSTAMSHASQHLVCFSHLRWDFVFQRPQHLMERFARAGRVTCWEEPVDAPDAAQPHLRVEVQASSAGVVRAVPVLPADLVGPRREAALRTLLDEYLDAQGPSAAPTAFWYYTPMMLGFSRERVRASSAVVVYDCMDELGAFRFAPPELHALEDELFGLADLVFTGGRSLYEAKRTRHAHVHLFPSSVDVDHFAAARTHRPAAASRPSFGFYGVIDERLDLGLIAGLADARPDWRIEIVGPTAKIDPTELPVRDNLSYPGSVAYARLPEVISGWDVALMPFAINDATRFISPTKTPEYLAGGRPVVSTPIADVVSAYADLDAVTVASDAPAFVAACEAALERARGPDRTWLDAADARLAGQSWDRTQAQMARLIQGVRADEPIIVDLPPVKPMAKPAAWPSRRSSHFDAVVVGAGFAGAVSAERLAAAGRRVLVLDRRPHIAGNAFDTPDAAGVLHHVYGPHIFHTNSDEVFRYLSRFTEWRGYEHRVLAAVEGRLVPIPINRTTLNRLYDLDLSSDEAAAAFLAARAEHVPTIRTSEDVVVAAVGRELYELFFRGYTRKQWGRDPSELDRSVTARVPTRTGVDDRYFTDTHQAMPSAGYTRMFERMLDHPNITVSLSTDFREVADEVLFDRLVFCGPVDEFFGRRFGDLPYRSLRFDHQTLDQEWFQPVGVVNHPSPEVPFTRVTEYKHLTGQTHRKTSITYEYPSDEGDPYYPIPTPETQALYKKYEALALARPDVDFVGRLATYRYYNMDQVVGQALAHARRHLAADTTRPSHRDMRASAAE